MKICNCCPRRLLMNSSKQMLATLAGDTTGPRTGMWLSAGLRRLRSLVRAQATRVALIAVVGKDALSAACKGLHFRRMRQHAAMVCRRCEWFCAQTFSGWIVVADKCGIA